MDDEPENEFPRPAPRPKMSMTPSWVMFGFILGALFVWLLPRENHKSGPAPGASAKAQPSSKVGVPSSSKKIDPTRLSDIEAIFDAYGEYAVWDNNRTEIAVWNAERKSFSDFFEVLRDDKALYFRSIPTLTRPVLTHGAKPDLPIIYTETEEMRQRWIETRRQLVPATVAPPSAPSAPTVQVDAPVEKTIPESGK